MFPDSVHTSSVGLSSADDEAIWQYAFQHGLTIVSKDHDFHQRSFLYGAPPKVIWIAVGNCSTSQVEGLIKEQRADILAFEADSNAAFLILGKK